MKSCVSGSNTCPALQGNGFLPINLPADIPWLERFQNELAQDPEVIELFTHAPIAKLLEFQNDPAQIDKFMADPDVKKLYIKFNEIAERKLIHHLGAKSGSE